MRDDHEARARLIGRSETGISGRLEGLAIGMVSLGCAKNRVDSEAMLGLVAQEGGEIVADPAEADVIIINTCGFLTDAKQESIDTIIEMGDYKTTGKCKALVVAGCLSQRHGDELAQHLPEVDVIIGVSQTASVIDAITKALDGEKVLANTGDSYLYDFEGPRLISTGAGTAYVKVSEGCSNCCSYCAIPTIRGSHKSRPIESVVAEVNALVKAGTHEIILIAQDTTRYGEDIYGSPRLAQLLRQLSDIEMLKWLRVLYMYPNRVTDELLDVMASIPNVCRYVDIPLQHAHPTVLRAMNRSGSPEELLSLLGRIRTKLPGVTIRTSFIVGFPGETDEQSKTLETFLKEAKFDRAGVFEYSQEEGTTAGAMVYQLPSDIKRKRRNRLMTIQRNISLESNRARVGSTVEVLLEDLSPKGSNLWLGRSRSEAPEVDGKVVVDVSSLTDVVPRPGLMVTVQIESAGHYDVMGKAIPMGAL